MLSLRTTASMEAALVGPLDPALKTIIALRMAQLSRDFTGDLADLVNFVIVRPGDTLNALTAELGFSLLRNFVDQTPFGDPEFTPSWEWGQDHGAWFELVFILSDNGFGTIVFVPDDPGVEFDVHALCLEHVRCPPQRCRRD